LCQLFKFGYISIYVVILELELDDFCAGSIFSGGIEVLYLEFLEEEVP
jgi:hypothetical protein